ncbi:MAG: aminotransferase class I/II-fold pyridoxal phosphate-dependent enzyme [Anaerolineae bacterium]|nr:aminotransferase class I/II-fold pyridoxal phosphate-dependent enzyme [Anaerolineae bacterium]
MIAPFKLERYFARYEFQARYLLSASDCESLSMPEVLELADADSLARWQSLNLGYTESLGLPALREEIALLYEKVSADTIMTLTPEEGIFICMQTLINPGDHVIGLFPAYQSLYEIARSRGCKVTPWLLKAGDNAWELDFDELENSLQEDTRLLVINFPHNPTGFLPRLPELLRIVDFARANHLYLFSDEMYRFLEYDPVRRLPPIADLYEKGISLSGLSKSFALPGLRSGWLATQDERLFHKWALYKDYTTICSSAPSEILSLAALRAREVITRRNVNLIGENLLVANAFFERFADQFNWLPPQAGSIAFPRLNMPVAIDDFCQQVIERKDVMLVPASMFDLPGNHFRIGLGRKNFKEALGLLNDFMLGI